MDLQTAMKIANKYSFDLRSYCLKQQIAGSIRRLKSEVKDIEIVCIPDPDQIMGFIQFIDGLKKIKGEATGKYTQRELLEGIMLDLFIADETNYGLIVMIRTGSWEFSKRMMWECKTKGFYVKDGYLHKSNTGEIVPVPSERDFFEICNIKWIEPKERVS